MAGEATFVVIETSRLGDSVLGVFSSLTAARAILPRDSARLQDYRIELHVVDEPLREEEAWAVLLSRDGDEAAAERVVLCSCGADHSVLHDASYIEPGGARMHVIVWALSRGAALAAAERYRVRLLQSGAWDAAGARLEAISATNISAD